MNLFFEYGDLVTCAGVFVNSVGTQADPDVVKFAYRAAAAGVTTTYTYGSDAALVKLTTGSYYVNIDTSESAGQFFWRWFSTGQGQTADQGDFYVRKART